MTTRGRRLARALGALLIFAVLVPTTASAQVTRTYVDIVVGSDVNDCTRAAPCATFQRAHDATVPNGEVNAVTPGNYSAVIINKPITIDGNGTEASITPQSGASSNLDVPR